MLKIITGYQEYNVIERDYYQFVLNTGKRRGRWFNRNDPVFEYDRFGNISSGWRADFPNYGAEPRVKFFRSYLSEHGMFAALTHIDASSFWDMNEEH